MAKDKLPKLYKTDDKLGVVEFQPGTKAEHLTWKLQGWSEKKPTKKEADQTVKQTGTAESKK